MKLGWIPVMVAVAVLGLLGCDAKVPNERPDEAAKVPTASDFTAFNLVCSGVEDKRTEAGGYGSSRFSTIVRVDLKANRWCVDECEETHPIDALTATEIRLQDDPADPSAYGSVSQKIMRESGRYFSQVTIGEYASFRTGQCTKMPFAGFPALKF